jgi:hypothetical protein
MKTVPLHQGRQTSGGNSEGVKLALLTVLMNIIQGCGRLEVGDETWEQELLEKVLRGETWLQLVTSITLRVGCSWKQKHSYCNKTCILWLDVTWHDMKHSYTGRNTIKITLTSDVWQTIQTVTALSVTLQYLWAIKPPTLRCCHYP